LKTNLKFDPHLCAREYGINDCCAITLGVDMLYGNNLVMNFGCAR
jgi:hypothetical protein